MAEETIPDGKSDAAEKPETGNKPRYNQIDDFDTFEANQEEDAVGRASGSVLGGVAGAAAGGLSGGIAGAVAGGALGSAADEERDGGDA